jgi:hypothetical protein
LEKEIRSFAGAQVSPTQGKIDIALSQFARGYRNNQLVAEILCPRVEVENQSDKFWQFGRENQKLVENQKRAPGAAAERINQTVSTDNYLCVDHSLERLITDEERGNFQAGDVDQWATGTLTDKILLGEENEVATLAGDTAQYAGANSTTLAGASQWSDPGNSTPLDDVEVAKSQIRQIGQEANVMIISDPVYQKLRTHPQIIDRFKYVNGGAINLESLSAVFEIERVVLASAVKVDANDNVSFVWGKNAILAYSQPNPSMMDPSFAKLFVWRGAPGTVGGFSIEIARSTPASRKSDELAIHSYFVPKVTSNVSAYLIKNAVA